MCGGDAGTTPEGGVGRKGGRKGRGRGGGNGRAEGGEGKGGGGGGDERRRRRRRGRGEGDIIILYSTTIIKMGCLLEFPLESL